MYPVLPRTVTLWCKRWDGKCHLIYTCASSIVEDVPHLWLFWHLKLHDILPSFSRPYSTFVISHIPITKCQHNILGNYIESFKIKDPLTIFKTKNLNQLIWLCVTVIKIQCYFQRNKNENRQNSFCWNSLHALWQDLVHVYLGSFDPALVLLCFFVFVFLPFCKRWGIISVMTSVWLMIASDSVGVVKDMNIWGPLVSNFRSVENQDWATFFVVTKPTMKSSHNHPMASPLCTSAG